jgi:hypothetical protein
MAHQVLWSKRVYGVITLLTAPGLYTVPSPLKKCGIKNIINILQIIFNLDVQHENRNHRVSLLMFFTLCYGFCSELFPEKTIRQI